MADTYYKEVNFKYYCGKCKHKDLDEKFGPCNECLDEPAREGTEVPRYFKGVLKSYGNESSDSNSEQK